MRTLALVPLLMVVGCGSSNASPSHQAEHHAHGHHGAGMHHRFDDPVAWSATFDAPERDAWQMPDRVIETLALPSSAEVADLGAGTGYFSMRIARVVTEGHVHAIDLEPSMVRHLANRAAEEGLTNVLAIEGTATESGLSSPVDVVLVVDTFHHIDSRPTYFAALRAQLRPGGRVVIVDFRVESEMGPPAEFKIAPEAVEAEMREAGYRLAAAHTFLPEQYFLEFVAN
jgi:cyclopropane fatty-acyl-phospholipid synthase-like methyltransferase